MQPPGRLEVVTYQPALAEQIAQPVGRGTRHLDRGRACTSRSRRAAMPPHSSPRPAAVRPAWATHRPTAPVGPAPAVGGSAPPCALRVRSQPAGAASTARPMVPDQSSSPSSAPSWVPANWQAASAAPWRGGAPSSAATLTSSGSTRSMRLLNSKRANSSSSLSRCTLVRQHLGGVDVDGRVVLQRSQPLREQRDLRDARSAALCAWRHSPRRRWPAPLRGRRTAAAAKAAVFSPMPGTPGMLSEVSPFSPMRSGIRRGGTPNRSSTAAGIVDLDLGHAPGVRHDAARVSPANCIASRSPVTM